MTQPDLFDRYPTSPGFKVGSTSQEAAEAIKPTAATLRAKCLHIFEHAHCTADEMAAILKESVLTIRPRCAELHAMKLIEDTGVRRPNKSGRNAIVWVASRDDARRTAGALNTGRHQ